MMNKARSIGLAVQVQLQSNGVCCSGPKGELHKAGWHRTSAQARTKISFSPALGLISSM
jgi:hypothetical protein